MRTRVMTEGNSLAVRIRKAYAGELGFVSEAEVEMSIDHGTLVLTPAVRCQTLGELLEKVTDENVHGEADTGRAVGDEAW